MRIQHNIMAMNAYRNLGVNNSALSKNLEKLSSGYKINRAGDDAAGLAISEKMRMQITGLEGAQKNAKDGISLVQTAEGALTEVHDMLNRMYSLAEQSANGTYEDETDRAQLQKELTALNNEIDRISKATNFNGINLLDGSLGGATVTAVDGTEGTAAASAVAAVYEFDLSGVTAYTSGASGSTLTIGDVTITVGSGSAPTTGFDAAAATTVAAQLNAISSDIANAFGSGYSVSVSGTTITVTAQTAGADTFGTKTITWNGTGVTSAEETKGADEVEAVSGTNATTTIDFSGKTGADMIGVTMEVNGTTYEFVENAADATAGTAIVVGKTDDDESIANAVNTAIGTTVSGYTGSVVTNTAGKNTMVELKSDDATDPDTVEAIDVSFEGGGRDLQIGDTGDDFNRITVGIDKCDATTLGTKALDIGTQGGARDALQIIESAINKVSDIRGGLGAIQNRLDHTINNLSVMTENIQDAESTIRDTDIAEEMMSYTKNNILIQSAQAMLAQANQVPQGVLQLLQ